jgi:putative ABC transport system permease protein
MKSLRVLIRTLLRQPGYVVLAVVTLAVGIGCNAAVFGLLDSIYFRPLPLRDQQDLTTIRLTSPRSTLDMISYPEYRELQRSVTAFQDVVAIGARGVTLRHGQEARLLIIHYVSGNYFDALGIPIGMGRGLQPSDDSADATTPRVVINHQLWQEELGARPDVIGSSIQLNDTLFTVAGVTAKGFVSLDRQLRTDVWVTTAQAHFVLPGLADELERSDGRWFQVMGRLAPGTALDQAQGQLDTVLNRWKTDNAQQYQNTLLTAQGFLDAHRKDVAQGTVFLILVGLVLLIASANVANLTLARSEGRRRDIAVRAALGASRTRLVRHGMMESLLLSATGAGAGLILAAWLVELFRMLIPPGAVTYVLDVRFDLRMFAFTALLTVFTTLLVGALPAWRGTRADILTGLKEGGTGDPHRAHGKARDFLVITQVAVSVVVLIASGLLVKSLANSLRINPGFDPHKNVATFYIVPGLRHYDAPGTYRFFERARQATRSLPGVTRTSYGIRLPAQLNESGWAADFTIPGHQPPQGQDYFRIKYTMVGPNYFELMGTRILSGRGIADTDLPEGLPVAVINDAMARRMWPGENPIGKTIVMGKQDPVWREVIGVAENNKIAGLYEDQEMYVYVPYAQDQQSFGLLLVEVAGDPTSVFGSVKSVIAGIDSNLPVLDTGTFSGHMEMILYEERRDASIGVAVSVVSFFLGVVGIYGVVSLLTARRMKEIGIRIALGAKRSDVLRLVFGDVLRLTAIGAGLGIAGGVIAGRLLQSRLHGVRSADPWNLVIGASIFVAGAVLASLMPTVRATHADPCATLKSE